ncbi:MAG: hypothetical protein ABGX43_05635 [Nitrospinaceae bacterium]
MSMIFFEDIIETRKEVPLLKLLESLGGWPVLQGDNWNAVAFDWQETVAKLREFNNDILVAVWVGPDGKESDEYIVQVRNLCKNDKNTGKRYVIFLSTYVFLSAILMEDHCVVVQI